MPAPTPPQSDEAPVSFRGLDLFPFQQRAIQAILAGRSVVVAAPTGAGKTLVADYAIDRALSASRRVVYTSPIKALSNQKFRDFRGEYGDEQVGIMTGDVTIQPDAPLLIMTTEIFRNTIFEDPTRLKGFDFVVFDEVHYLGDRERGTVWEEAIIYAPPHIRVVALSATVPNVEQFAAWIRKVRDASVDVVVEEERPVPLVHKVWIPGRGPRSLREVRAYFTEIGRFDRRGRWVHRSRNNRDHNRGRRGRRMQRELVERASGKLIDYLEQKHLLPAITFCFSRLDCERLAERNARRDLLSADERRRMLALFDELAERYEVQEAQDTRRLRDLASRGVLHHHAGMLPIDKEIVERLFTTGLVRLLFATETFSLGVNMPARTVVFHALTKFDGVGHGPILSREYWQMAGRAGRQGIDERGWVYSLLDESRIGYYDLERLQSGRTEPVLSRFDLNYSGILNLYRRTGDKTTEAWLRSYARYQRDAKGKARGKKRDGTRQIAARLSVLEQFNYIARDDQTLTAKGELCSRVNGYEVAVTEAYSEGWLFRADAVQLVMMFSAMVYEARPRDESSRPKRTLKGLAVPFSMHMEALAAQEVALGVENPTRGLDFGLAGPVQLWAEGRDFETVLAHTSLAPGDLVRVLRMTIQLLRQTAHALPKGDPCIETLESARERIDRDVVDARRQLELG